MILPIILLAFSSCCYLLPVIMRLTILLATLSALGAIACAVLLFISISMHLVIVPCYNFNCSYVYARNGNIGFSWYTIYSDGKPVLRGPNEFCYLEYPSEMVPLNFTTCYNAYGDANIRNGISCPAWQYCMTNSRQVFIDNVFNTVFIIGFLILGFIAFILMMNHAKQEASDSRGISEGMCLLMKPDNPVYVIVDPEERRSVY